MSENPTSQRRIQRLETELAHHQDHLAALEQNEKALCAQLTYTTNAAERKNLERQLAALQEEIATMLGRYEATENKLAAAKECNPETVHPQKTSKNNFTTRDNRLIQHSTLNTQHFPIPHNLPRSNAWFVGRTEELACLHQQLQQNDRLVISAIAGMGGIGKTELALHYALRHLEWGTYTAGLCWLQARQSEMGPQLVTFARNSLGIDLPDGLTLAEQVSACWRRWPAGEALIIFDDVLDYDRVRPILPPGERRFKLLFTTRQHFSAVQELRLDVLDGESAIALLTQLAGPDRIQTQPQAAKALCAWLGHLPLGLELVGRYLEGNPDLSLSELQQRLADKGLNARALVQPEAGMTAELGIAAAFELSWQELSPTAQQLGCLLSLFALAPIPWSLVVSVAQQQAEPQIEPQDEQQANGVLLPADEEALEELRDRSLRRRHLLQRTGQGTYRLHPLLHQFFSAKQQQAPGIQALQQRYCRALVALAKTLPWPPTRHQLAALAPTIPHLEAAATTLQDSFHDEALVVTFKKIAWFWHGQTAYKQAQLRYEQGLSAARARLGNDHPDTADILNDLAELYHDQGRYAEAEPLFLQALKIRQRQLGNNHPDTATTLNNLASLCRYQGCYEKAEPLYMQALEIRQRQLGDNHPDTAVSLDHLAELYRLQGHYGEAELLCLQALEIRQRQLGDNHPYTALSLNDLALLYTSQGRYGEAELLCLQALEIRQRQLGDDHPYTAHSLNNLAKLYQSQGYAGKAETLYLQALEIKKRQLRDDHPSTAKSLHNLASLYQVQGRDGEAESLYRQALEIRSRVLGEEHPDTAKTRNALEALDNRPDP